MRKIKLIAICISIVTFIGLLMVGCSTNDGVASISLKDHDPNSTIEISMGKFDYSDYVVVATYESGAVEEIALEENMISDTDRFKFYQEGEHEITVSYAKKTYVFKVSVKKLAFGSLALPENNVFTYDGEAHTVEVEGDIPANAVITYPSGNSFVNAGTYDVTAIVSCNGYASVKLYTTVKIERAKYDMSDVKFESQELVYDGRSHSIEITGTLPEGVSKPTYYMDGNKVSSVTDVGEYKITAKFESRDTNYEAIPDMEATLKILPAEYIMDEVELSFKNANGILLTENKKVYDGLAVSFDLTDAAKLSNKLTISFSVFDESGNLISTSQKNTNIKDVGVYTVQVDFSLADGKNYNPIKPKSWTFEVKKADYEIEDVRMESMYYVYDGAQRSIEVEGKIPDGVTVTYEYYSNGVLLTDSNGEPVQSVSDAGRYSVKAIFAHSEKNYKDIDPISAVLYIDVAFDDLSHLVLSDNNTYVYDGTERTIGIIGTIPDYLSVSYKYYIGDTLVTDSNGNPVTAVSEVGNYTVEIAFSANDKNHSVNRILNDTLVIEKAKINLDDIKIVGVGDYTYDGTVHKTSLEGVHEALKVTQEKIYLVGGTGALTEVDSAVNCGNYTVIYTFGLKDDKNYEIVGGSEKEGSLSILQKVVDISNINIVSAESTYDGEDHYPVLKNLPDHVSIDMAVYMSGEKTPIDQVINAGMYRVEVVVSAESSNYSLSSNGNLVFDLEILQKPVDVSNLEFDSLTFMYNGNSQNPKLKNLPEGVGCGYNFEALISDSNIYEVEGSVNSGKYRVTCRLVPQNSNYVLVGETNISAEYEIKQMQIDINALLKDSYDIAYKAEGYSYNGTFGKEICKQIFGDLSIHFEILPVNIYSNDKQAWVRDDYIIEKGSYKVKALIRVIYISEGSVARYNYCFLDETYGIVYSVNDEFIVNIVEAATA